MSVRVIHVCSGFCVDVWGASARARVLALVGHAIDSSVGVHKAWGAFYVRGTWTTIALHLVFLQTADLGILCVLHRARRPRVCLLLHGRTGEWYQHLYQLLTHFHRVNFKIPRLNCSTKANDGTPIDLKTLDLSKFPQTHIRNFAVIAHIGTCAHLTPHLHCLHTVHAYTDKCRLSTHTQYTLSVSAASLSR